MRCLLCAHAERSTQCVRREKVHRLSPVRLRRSLPTDNMYEVCKTLTLSRRASRHRCSHVLQSLCSIARDRNSLLLVCVCVFFRVHLERACARVGFLFCFVGTVCLFCCSCVCVLACWFLLLRLFYLSGCLFLYVCVLFLFVY